MFPVGKKIVSHILTDRSFICGILMTSLIWKLFIKRLRMMCATQNTPLCCACNCCTHFPVRANSGHSPLLKTQECCNERHSSVDPKLFCTFPRRNFTSHLPSNVCHGSTQNNVPRPLRSTTVAHACSGFTCSREASPSSWPHLTVFS